MKTQTISGLSFNNTLENVSDKLIRNISFILGTEEAQDTSANLSSELVTSINNTLSCDGRLAERLYLVCS